MERLGLSVCCAIGLGLTALAAHPASCTFDRAHYTYTADPALTVSFVKLPPTVDYLGDLGMSLEVDGKQRYGFVVDGGSRFSQLIIPVRFTGPKAWEIEEGKPSVPGLHEMDFHQWSGNKLFGGIPKTGAQAPHVLFIPDLDESLRHSTDAPVEPQPGFFKLSLCE